MFVLRFWYFTVFVFMSGLLILQYFVSFDIRITVLDGPKARAERSQCVENAKHIGDRRLLAHTVGCPCTTYVGGDKSCKPLPVRVRGAGPVHGIGINAYPPFRVESDP